MNEGLYLNALNKSLNVFKRDGQEVERVQVSWVLVRARASVVVRVLCVCDRACLSIASSVVCVCVCVCVCICSQNCSFCVFFLCIFFQ